MMQSIGGHSSSGGFSHLVQQANHLSSEISQKRAQHRTFSGSGNRLLNTDFGNEQEANELQMSLGPNSQKQGKLDEMMEGVRAQIDRPVTQILQATNFVDRL